MIHENYPLATTFAILGAALWSIQLAPQIYKNYRRQSTEGLSALLMLLWSIAAVPLGIYNIVNRLNIGLQIQPQLFMTLSFICYIQTHQYRKKWSVIKSAAIVIGTLSLFGSIEVGGIYLLRYCLDTKHISWPVTLMGILTAVCLNGGMVPQYYEIYKNRFKVIGISYLFLCIDLFGALFSFTSLLFQQWDWLAAVSYGLLAVLEMGIFAIGGVQCVVKRRTIVEEAALVHVRTISGSVC